MRKKGERILIVADLHVGWEASLAQRGVHIPSQTPKLRRRLMDLIKLCKPTSIMLLGDVKHTVATAEAEERHDVPELLEAIRKEVLSLYVVPGNHDGNLEPLLPEGAKMLPSSGASIEDIGLFHGHTWPAVELLRCKTLIIGHSHPVVLLRDPTGFKAMHQVWVKADLNVSELTKRLLKRSNVKFEEELKMSELIILPSFNDFLGGQPINVKETLTGKGHQEFISPVLRSGSVDVDGAEAYLLDGTLLGTVRQLRGLA